MRACLRFAVACGRTLTPALSRWEREREIVANPRCTPGCLPAQHGALADEVLEGEEDGDVTGYAEDHL